MKHRIEKAAVLGAGTMGARIAAHLANAGIPCYLLDIVPRGLNAEEQHKSMTLETPAVRNRIVLAGLAGAKKWRPAAKITKARKTSLVSHFVERCSAGIGSGDQGANAGARDEINGNFVLLEDPQHSNVGDAARKSAAERDPNFGPRAAGVVSE